MSLTFNLDRHLSPHFRLGEMVRTSHRRIDNTPSLDVVDRLTMLCQELLEPVRERFGPLWVTSGYRCAALNTTIGGSSTSAHLHGCAADFVPVWDVSTHDIVKWIVSSNLLYDQVIDEYSSTANWVHLGMVRPGIPHGPRKQALVMRHGTYTEWSE